MGVSEIKDKVCESDAWTFPCSWLVVWSTDRKCVWENDRCGMMAWMHVALKMCGFFSLVFLRALFLVHKCFTVSSLWSSYKVCSWECVCVCVGGREACECQCLSVCIGISLYDWDRVTVTVSMWLHVKGKRRKRECYAMARLNCVHL